MKYKKNILLIILIISTLCLILIPKSVVGSIADIHYSFKNDNLYSYVDDSEIFVNKLSNAKNSSEYTETYEASHSFTNEIDGTSGTDIDFIDVLRSTPNITIEGEYLGHDKILNITSGSIWSGGYNIFAGQTNEVVEFWINSLQIDERVRFGITEGQTLFANDGIILELYSDSKLYYFQPAQTYIMDYSLNTWYHFRIEFNVATDWHLWINGISMDGGGGYAFSDGQVSMTHLGFIPSTTTSAIFIDAVGYSWDINYTIGQNFIPLLNIDTSIQEVDRWEFAYSSFEVLYSVGTSIFSDWTELNDPHDDLTIATNLDWNSDRRILADHGTPEIHDLGIEREFTISSTIINVSWAWEIVELPAIGEYRMKIYSSDDTLVASLYQINNFLRGVDDGGLYELDNGMTINKYMQFNWYINYNDELSVLEVREEGVLLNRYNINLITSGKSGLGKIEMFIDVNAGVNLKVYYDYVGVYANGISLSTEFGHLRINEIVPIGDFWYFSSFNLVNFYIIGNASIWVSEGSIYLIGISPIVEIAKNNIYNSADFSNTYDLETYFGAPTENDPIIWFQFWGQFSLNSLSIDGVKLHQGINEYSLNFSYNNVDINESYFYVDIDNKLQFILITNDTNTEYIQATFDIPNVDSTDRAISFRGYRLNKAFGYFYVDYLVSASKIEIPIIEKTTRAILPPNNTIDNFIVLISDNDVDTILGITTGYVSQPILLNVLGLGLPITTASLIEMMIPLLLIIVPTLLISKGFGKEGKKLLIPLFLVFSLIATATFIIPVWIFFIIAFGTGLFLFRNKEIESEI